MRALVLDAETMQRVTQVMAYARQHIWHPDSDVAPGDYPGYTCHLNTYRCVFTYTKSADTGKLFRHLSVSVPSTDYPSPEAIAMIAGLFEFSGADEGIGARLHAGKWMMHVERNEPHCIVLAEELTDD